MPGLQSPLSNSIDLLATSFTTPNITYAGKNPIYVLDGTAGGGGVSELNNLTGIIDITSTDDTVDIVATGQTINLSVPAVPFPDYVATINALSNAVSIISSDGSLTIGGVGQDIDIQVNPIAVVESLNTIEGIVNITSPGDTIGITINGQDIELEAFGTAGVSELNTISGSVTLISPNSSVAISVVGQNIELETVSGGPANILSGSDIFITADEGLTVSKADINILARNGDGGNISLISQAGGASQKGGIISLESQGGSGVGGLFGRVSITAQPGTDVLSGITTGGVIDMRANTGFATSALCSIIRQDAAAIQTFAGAYPVVPTIIPGFQTIYGNQGISLCVGFPAILPQVPYTMYQYAPGGISLDSTVYTNQVRPYWPGVGDVTNLFISGRSLPASAYVVLEDVKSIDMSSTGSISGVNTINGAAYPPPGGGSAAGPSGSIQYSDGAGGFQGNNGLLYNGTSRITNSTGNNFIDIDEVANSNSVAIQSLSQINMTASDILGLTSLKNVYLTSGIAARIEISGSTGLAGQVLTSDGVFTEWQDPPAKPAPQYASFSSDQPREMLAANTPRSIPHNTTEINTGGFTLLTTGIYAGSIQVATAGDYEVGISIQFIRLSGASVTNVNFWFRVNGVDIPRSCSQVSITGNDAEFLATVSIIPSLAADDVIEVMFGGPDIVVEVYAEAAQTTPMPKPAIPSIITNLKLLS